MVRRNTIGNTAEEINLDFLHEQLLLAMKKIKISDGSIDKDTVLREITAYYERKFSSLTNDAFSYDFIDLFCGAGGLSIGLEQVGFKPIIAIDKDEAALRTYRFNRPWMTEQSLIHEDIRDLVDSDIFPHVPVIVGGPPCQGFSVVNKHKKENDERNELYKFYVHAVSQSKPKIFLMENVEGILKLYDTIKSDFANVGYAIGLAIAAEEYGSKFYANGAAPSGVLEHPGTIKDPSRVRESWTQTFGGSANANKVAVLEEGMKYTPISISPNEAQFLETRKFQINEIARIFRVPPHMVGDLEKSSFSNIEQQSLEFVKYTLDPWVSRWEQSMIRSLLTVDEKSTYFIKFNVDGLLRGDYQSRMNGYAIGRQNGWMSANDIRELENLDRIPAELGGDLYLINGNMTKLQDAGIFAASGKEEDSDEEVLELDESEPDGDTAGTEDSHTERHHRRGKLV